MAGTDPANVLPSDVWELIFLSLPPREIIRARCVSSTWHRVLTDPKLCRRFLQVAFPNCRETRLDMLQHHMHSLPDIPHNLRVEVQCRAQQKQDWPKTLATVARRYHHLQRGTPRECLKLPMPKMVDLMDSKDYACFDGAMPLCHRFFTFVYYSKEDQSKEFHFPDPMWWYSQEDGLLVYPASWRLDVEVNVPVKWAKIDKKLGLGDCGTHFMPPKAHSEDFFLDYLDDESGGPRFGLNSPSPPCEGFLYRLFDPETGDHILIPFDLRDKTIRRVRLAQGVLIFEWTETPVQKPCPANEPHVKESRGYAEWTKTRKDGGYTEWAKRYGDGRPDFLLVRNTRIVTVFDVLRRQVKPALETTQHRGWTWEVRLRYEWKLPCWGCGPREELIDPLNPRIFEDNRPRFFSAHTASHYALYISRPGLSSDLVCQLYVWDISAADGEHGHSHSKGHSKERKKRRRNRPILIRRMLERDLSFYADAFDESDKPRLRNISLDEHNVYLVQEGHRRAHLGGPFFNGTNSHALVSMSVPVIPFPPAGPKTRAPSLDMGDVIKNPVYGPQWVDVCPDNNHGFVLEHQDFQNLAPRHETVFCRDFVHSKQVATARSSQAAVPPPYSLLPRNLLPTLRGLPYPWNRSDAATNPLQPRNFPGSSPCWCHENWPYMGISSVTDYAAGVRFVARDSRPINTMTPLLHPSITVNISGRGRADEGGEEDHVSSQVEPRNIRSDEVEVESAAFWENMMGRMTLGGDERWLVGQDSENNVTLVRF